jgi:hypothetical protein
MTDVSYNKFSAIKIGGLYTNIIDTSYGNVSLDVSGHTLIRGNIYIEGTANIDVSGGGFSGNDLSLNGNIYLGGDFYSSNVFSSMNIYANTITHKTSDGVDCMTQYYNFAPDEVQWESNKNFTINTINGKYFNATSGAAMGFDASQNTSFTSRNGQISFLAEQGDMLFDSSLSMNITSRQGDIDMYPRNGTNGSLILNGKLDLFDGITCREPSSILDIRTTDFLNVYGTAGSQINVYQTGVTTKSTSIGYDASNNIGFIGSGGTNVDFSISSGRYIKLTEPIYVDYAYADISRSNWQIGWTQNTASPNNGDNFTGTASDSVTPAQVGTFTLPSFGVWLIQFNCLLTLNTGSDTITNKGITLSDLTASNTPCAPGFRMTDPIDDAAGSASARQTYSFSGIYHYTSSTVAAKFINVSAQTSGSRTVTASGSYKYTRIA